MIENQPPSACPNLSTPQFSTQQVCANCKFWQVSLCHRYPPTGDGETMVFPTTKPGDWCGEYQFQTRVQDQFIVKQTYNLP